MVDDILENYFFETINSTGTKRIFVLIIYDIVENKKRNKFARFLEGYGIRVQKSAFEARLTDKKYRQLIHAIPAFCGDQDSIRVYRITGESQVTAWGGKEIPQDSEDVIII